MSDDERLYPDSLEPEILALLKPKRCKHELIADQCATCLGTDRVDVPNPFEGIHVEELDPEKDLGGDR